MKYATPWSHQDCLGRSRDICQVPSLFPATGNLGNLGAHTRANNANDSLCCRSDQEQEDDQVELSQVSLVEAGISSLEQLIELPVGLLCASHALLRDCVFHGVVLVVERVYKGERRR